MAENHSKKGGVRTTYDRKNPAFCVAWLAEAIHRHLSSTKSCENIDKVRIDKKN